MAIAIANKEKISMDNKFSIKHKTFLGDADYGFHYHDFYEIFLFIDGHFDYYVEDKIFRLRPGDLIIIDPGKIHKPQMISNSSMYNRYVLWLDTSFIRTLDGKSGTLFSDSDKYLIHLDAKEVYFVSKIFDLIIKYRSDKESAGSLINSFLCFIQDKKLPADNSIISGDERHIIQNVIKYINEHFAEQITLDMLCRNFYLSKYYLNRKFKSYTNSTIHDYIISKRIAFSRQLIRSGESVSSAAEKCGFNDYSNFYKSFIKKTGVPPAEFKKGLSQQ